MEVSSCENLSCCEKIFQFSFSYPYESFLAYTEAHRYNEELYERD